MSIDYFGQKLAVCSIFVLFTKRSKLERKQNKQRVNSRQTVSKQGEPIARVPQVLENQKRTLRAYFRGVGQVQYRFAIRISFLYIQKDRDIIRNSRTTRKDRSCIYFRIYVQYKGIGKLYQRIGDVSIRVDRGGIIYSE